jgi:hypothetical protein
MSVKFLEINDKDKIAFIYEANGFEPEKKPEAIQKTDDGRLVKRLQDVIEDDTPKQKPLVIMLHDFPDHSHMNALDGLFDTYAKRLKADGFPTLRFDFRGCGESDGRQQDFCFDTAIEDFKTVMRWARKRHGHDRFAIIAAGMSACTLAQAYNKDTMSSIVLLWPVFIPMHTPLKAIDELKNRQFMTEHDYALVGDNKIGFLLANEMRQMNIMPLLNTIHTITQVQQGTADVYTPYESTDVIKKYLKGLRDFGVFEDGEHYLPDPQMRKQMIDNTLYFLNKYAYRLPPGRLRNIGNAPIFKHQG